MLGRVEDRSRVGVWRRLLLEKIRVACRWLALLLLAVRAPPRVVHNICISLYVSPNLMLTLIPPSRRLSQVEEIMKISPRQSGVSGFVSYFAMAAERLP